MEAPDLRAERWVAAIVRARSSQTGPHDVGERYRTSFTRLEIAPFIPYFFMTLTR